MIKVVHVNSSEYAGGVAEMLVSLINKFGSDYTVDRHVIKRNKDFFEVTKKIHNNLHYKDVSFSDDEILLYHNSKNNPSDIEKLSKYDVVVIHDPQPAPLIETLREQNYKGKIIWRLHVPCDDQSFSWNSLLKNYVNQADIAIFTMKDYVPKGLEIPYKLFTPCIDEYSIKNIEIGMDLKNRILNDLGIKRPFIVQVSRFDLLKGVEELVEAYNELASNNPDTQYILASNLATDDPEGIEIYKKLCERKKGKNVRMLILSDDVNLNKLQVNTLQTEAEMVIHNSTQEGFGLAVTEAMYKRNIIITKNVGGIGLQVKHKKNGLIYNVNKNIKIAINEVKAMNWDDLNKIRKNARDTVEDKFTMSILVKNYKKVINKLLKGE